MLRVGAVLGRRYRAVHAAASSLLVMGMPVASESACSASTGGIALPTCSYCLPFGRCFQSRHAGSQAVVTVVMVRLTVCRPA